MVGPQSVGARPATAAAAASRLSPTRIWCSAICHLTCFGAFVLDLGGQYADAVFGRTRGKKVRSMNLDRFDGQTVALFGSGSVSL